MDAHDASIRLIARSHARMVDRRAVRRHQRATDFASRNHYDLRGGVRADGVALALRPCDDPVGCQVAVLPAGAVPRDFDRARRMAVVDAACVRRLASDFRSAVFAVLAAARPAGRAQSGDQPAGLRRCGLRVSVPGRHRHHPVLPRPRMARRRGGGGGACVRARRRRQRTRAAYRPGHQPRLSAADPVAAGARAGALVVARGPRRRRTGWPDGDRPRPGGAVVPLCADRLRAGLLAHRQGRSRSRTGDAAAALGRHHERSSGDGHAGHHDHAAGGTLESSRGQFRVRPPPARSIRSICCNSSSPICSAR